MDITLFNLARELAIEIGFEDDRNEEISIYNELLDLLLQNEFLNALIEHEDFLNKKDRKKAILALEKFYQVSYKRLRIDDLAYIKSHDFDTAIGLITLFFLYMFRDSTRNKAKHLQATAQPFLPSKFTVPYKPNPRNDMCSKDDKKKGRRTPK